MKTKITLFTKAKKQITGSFFILAILILTAPSTVNAQESASNYGERISAGVKLGVNYANVWDEEGQDFRADPKLGLAGGIFIGIPFGKYIGFQPEFLISQKGFKGSGTLLGTGYSLNRTSTYFDIPLQLQIKLIKNLSLYIGPQYSYLLKQKDVYTLGSNSFEQEEEFKNDNIRKNILGFVIGADINIEQLVLSARIGWDLNRNNGDGTSSTPRYKNQWLQFTAGYRI